MRQAELDKQATERLAGQAAAEKEARAARQAAAALAAVQRAKEAKRKPVGF